MLCNLRQPTFVDVPRSRRSGGWLPLALTILWTLAALGAQAQTFSVLHNFTNGAGGAWPWSPVTVSPNGHLYGTTFHGGDYSQEQCQLSWGQPGCGIVWEMFQQNSDWLFNPLFAFQIQDGGYPHSGVIIGSDGELYGANPTGGQLGEACETLGCGTVYKVHPGPTRPSSLLLGWKLNLVYSFTGSDNDGGEPTGLIQDASGNLYGGDDGGAYTCGVIYELSRSGGTWTLTDLYNGFYCPDGSSGVGPGGLVFDSVGNLYGVTFYGGPQGCAYAQEGCGTVFKLTHTDSGWVETTLHEFNGATDGALVGGLVIDHAGNLYGGAEAGGPGSGGTVWELSPSNGGWTFNVIYSFQNTQPFSGPEGRLAMDASGNLYGVTEQGTYTQGNVFKLSPSNGGWQYTDLYDFTGGSDGAFPLAGPTLDTVGNLYGTASYGGPGNYGNVWKITQ